jgi:hypothetical protein
MSGSFTSLRCAMTASKYLLAYELTIEICVRACARDSLDHYISQKCTNAHTRIAGPLHREAEATSCGRSEGRVFQAVDR